MQNLRFLVVLIGLSMIACNKEATVNIPLYSLNGSWRMIQVKENLNGITTSKPFSLLKEVEITFTPQSPTHGTFTGFTPTNEIGINSYSIGDHQTLSIPVLAITKVAETSWGKLFVDNIIFTETYRFRNRHALEIITPDKTLVFKKI